MSRSSTIMMYAIMLMSSWHYISIRFQ